MQADVMQTNVIQTHVIQTIVRNNSCQKKFDSGNVASGAMVQFATAT